MEKQLKSLLVASQKILRISKGKNPQYCVDLLRQIEHFQYFSQSEFIVLSSTSANQVIQTLVELLSSSNISINVLTQLFSLLNNFGLSQSIRELLVHYRTLTVLSSLIPNLKDQCALECLKLIEHLTREESISVQVRECEKLLKYCSTLMLSANAPNTHLMLSLEILVNICVGNLSAQTWLKGLPHYESFQHKLVSLLSDKNVSVIIISLHLLATLSLKDPLGDKIFKPSNMEQTLQLSLSIICTSHDPSTVRHAVELVQHLVSSSPNFQHSMAEYSQLKCCLQKGFGRLSEVGTRITTKILDLSITLCFIPELSTYLISVLLSPSSRRRGGENSSFVSLMELLSENDAVYAEAVNAGLKLTQQLLKLSQSSEFLCHHTSLIKSLLSALIGCIQTPVDYSQGEEILLIILRRQKQALMTLSALVESDVLLKPITSALDLSVLKDVVQDQLAHNPLSLGHGHNRWSDVGVCVTIVALNILRQLCHEDSTKIKLTHLYQDTRILSLISYALQSREKADLKIALSLLVYLCSTGSTAIDSVSETLSSCNEESKDHHTLSLPSIDFAAIPCSESSPTLSYNNGESSKLDAKQLEQLIDRFKSGMEIQDVRASEIMNVYEHKLQAMTTKENHLQDLLDAKALALSQADRLLGQYRTKMTQADSECQKLRVLLQDTEKDCEILKDKVHTLQQAKQEDDVQIKQLESEKSHLVYITEKHKELTCSYQEQTKRLESLQHHLVEIEKQKDNLQNQVVLVTKSQQDLEAQLKSKCEEIEQTSQQLNHCQTSLQNMHRKCEELTAHVSNLESHILALSQNKLSLETEVERLTKCLTSVEDKNSVLLQQNTILESHNNQLQTCVEKLEEKNAMMSQQINSLEKQEDQLQRNINQLETKNTSLSQQINTLEDQKNHLQESVHQLEGRNSILVQQISTLEELKFKLQSQIDQSEKKIKKIEEENFDLKREVDLFSAVKNLISKSNQS